MTKAVRVLLDATAIPRDLGGVGRYVHQLAGELDARDDVELVIVGQSHDRERLRAAAPASRILALRARWSARPLRLLWEQLGLPGLARRVGAEVIHSPHYTLPLRSPVPVVVTLHDATFFSHPELHSPLKRRFFRSWIRLAVRRAAVAVAPSAATAEEVARHVGRRPAHEVVAFHGVDLERFRRPSAAETAALRESLGLPERWIAFLGTVEPRKNVAALVRAVAALPAALRPALVIAGAPGWDEETGALVAALPADVDVRLLGYLPIEQLPPLLGGATVFAYPSLGEGFGLPVLEAMACGAPVLTTRELALPEVGGDAVEYTGTGSAQIEGALRRLLEDPALRERLAAAGPPRAAEFTWAASAEAHARAFRLAAEGAR